MKRFLSICVAVMLAAMVASAQQRLSCTHFSKRGQTRAYLPPPIPFDPQKTYRQPVLLVSFSDRDFSMDDPAAYYNRLFNESGFNEGAGAGCVADYFREQSSGRLNLQFDIYGPVKLDTMTAGGRSFDKYGDKVVDAAVEKLCETETTNFSIYDWNQDGEVDQLVVVLAGYSGNQVAGYVWPSAGLFSGKAKLPGGVPNFMKSVTCEKWKDNRLCGIGTIVHEFCHTLGLPDIYPLSPATGFSVADEWDLMDGGNYTNYGWCPPSLTAMERMYLGWDQPVELLTATTITGMKPLSEGGKTYIIRNPQNSNEYYLLENRKQSGWDFGIPGNGLLISHVDFDEESWATNAVNMSDTYYRYDIFHADGKSYRDWDPADNGKDDTKWVDKDHLHNKFLSTSVYPYTNPETLVINASLTNESNPAATLFTANTDGLKLMSKPITNIQLADDGSISFDFMKEGTGIKAVVEDEGTHAWYDLQGRRLQGKPAQHGVYIKNRKKVAF